MPEFILEIKDVVKNYAGHRALDHINLSIPTGSIYGLLGPNGAGKTSLIRIVNQITGPDEGTILFEGKPLSPNNIYDIGYLPEERGLYKKMKVGEQLLYLAKLKGLKEREATEKLKAWFEKFEIAQWWNKTIEDLSKGMQQKVQFIATVVHEPKLIILDEPFSGFDPINANLIKDEILELKEKGSTIIFSTHRMESVEELCDYIGLINKSKKVLEGKKVDLKEQFKPHTFSVEYSGELEASGQYYNLISSQVNLNHTVSAVLKSKQDSGSNEIIRELLDQVNIISFKEDMASMNDVFINAVKN